MTYAGRFRVLGRPASLAEVRAQPARLHGDSAPAFRRKFCVLLQAALRRWPAPTRPEKTKDQWRCGTPLNTQRVTQINR